MTPPKAPIGAANLAALIAAVIGSIGGLFALGVAPAIITRDIQYLASTPMLSLISFFLCGVAAWLLGGQLGPWLQLVLGNKRGLIVGGIGGGLAVFLGMVTVGWFLSTR